MHAYLEGSVKKAIEQRKKIITADTNCYRLFDSIGDGIPGLWVDWFDGRAVIQIQDTNAFSAEELQGIAAELRASSVYLKRLDQHQKESPAHLAGEPVDQPFCVLENGIRYEIDFQSGYSQGIFLDQRDNRREVTIRTTELGLDGRLLNLFAYTCGFSVAAAMGGATTTSVDLSRPYLDWGKRNLAHNKLDPASHYYVKGDVFEWLQVFAKKGRTWHGIVLDPPTFSHGEKKKVFRVETDYAELVEMASRVLAPDGWLLCSANTRTLSAADFERQVFSGVLAAGRKVQTRRFAPMPPDFSGEQYLKSLWVEVKEK